MSALVHNFMGLFWSIYDLLMSVVEGRLGFAHLLAEIICAGGTIGLIGGLIALVFWFAAWAMPHCGSFLHTVHDMAQLAPMRMLQVGLSAAMGIALKIARVPGRLLVRRTISGWLAEHGDALLTALGYAAGMKWVGDGESAEYRRFHAEPANHERRRRETEAWGEKIRAGDPNPGPQPLPLRTPRPPGRRDWAEARFGAERNKWLFLDLPKDLRFQPMWDSRLLDGGFLGEYGWKNFSGETLKRMILAACDEGGAWFFIAVAIASAVGAWFSSPPAPFPAWAFDDGTFFGVGAAAKWTLWEVISALFPSLSGFAAVLSAGIFAGIAGALISFGSTLELWKNRESEIYRTPTRRALALYQDSAVDRAWEIDAWNKVCSDASTWVADKGGLHWYGMTATGIMRGHGDNMAPEMGTPILGDYYSRYTHTLVIGRTGSGKTQDVIIPHARSTLSSDRRCGVFILCGKATLPRDMAVLDEVLDRQPAVIGIRSMKFEPKDERAHEKFHGRKMLSIFNVIAGQTPLDFAMSFINLCGPESKDPVWRQMATILLINAMSQMSFFDLADDVDIASLQPSAQEVFREFLSRGCMPFSFGGVIMVAQSPKLMEQVCAVIEAADQARRADPGAFPGMPDITFEIRNSASWRREQWANKAKETTSSILGQIDANLGCLLQSPEVFRRFVSGIPIPGQEQVDVECALEGGRSVALGIGEPDGPAGTVIVKFLDARFNFLAVRRAVHKRRFSKQLIHEAILQYRLADELRARAECECRPLSFGDSMDQAKDILIERIRDEVDASVLQSAIDGMAMKHADAGASPAEARELALAKAASVAAEMAAKYPTRPDVAAEVTANRLARIHTDAVTEFAVATALAKRAGLSGPEALAEGRKMIENESKRELAIAKRKYGKASPRKAFVKAAHRLAEELGVAPAKTRTDVVREMLAVEQAKPDFDMEFEFERGETIHSDPANHCQVYKDEAHMLFSVSKNDSDATLTPISRSMGVAFLAGTQSIKQVVTTLGEDQGRALLENYATKIFLPTTDPDTREMIKELGGESLRGHLAVLETSNNHAAAKFLNGDVKFETPGGSAQRKIMEANPLYASEGYDGFIPRVELLAMGLLPGYAALQDKPRRPAERDGRWTKMAITSGQGSTHSQMMQQNQANYREAFQRSDDLSREALTQNVQKEPTLTGGECRVNGTAFVSYMRSGILLRDFVHLHGRNIKRFPKYNGWGMPEDALALEDRASTGDLT